MRIVLADDEPLALERLLFAFQDIDGVEVVGSAGNGAQASEMIRELKPDVVILDIQMPGRSGLGVAAELQGPNRPEVIFLTAFEQHALDAFDVEAVDYLLKPLRIDRLRQAVERARRRRTGGTQASPPAALPPTSRPEEDDAGFWVQGKQGLVRVPVAAIEWVEAAKDYVLLHTRERSHILRATMAALEERLPPDELVRVHRSAFVRPSLVREVQRTGAGAATLVLSGDVAVPVGPTYLPFVLERFG